MFLQGMTFLHDSTLHAHGNLTSSNCLVTSRWSLKVTDFGLAEARYHAHELEQEEHAKYRRTFERNASNLMALYARMNCISAYIPYCVFRVFMESS